MKPAVHLNHFEIVKPKHHVAQTELLKWIIDRHIKSESLSTSSAATEADLELIKKLFNRYAVKETQISARFIEADDILSSDEHTGSIYAVSKENPSGRSILERTEYFAKRAFEVFQKLYPAALTEKQPDHLIHVTCTGYISPSAPQRIVTSDFWQKETDITHAYHMGCYAAMPAVRLAESLVRNATFSNESFKTDIVHTEMCALHMNPLAQTPEQMIVQTLFADGHIKYTASLQKQEGAKSLRLVAMSEQVITDSEQDMSWVPAPWGMQMNLSREVPQKIKVELKKFFEKLLIKANVNLPRAMSGLFAVHPGGPKIIDSVQETLELSDSQVAASKKILFERGNMSSATLPHVWHEILQQNPISGTLITSFAFGPGLTLFGSIFEVVD